MEGQGHQIIEGGDCYDGEFKHNKYHGTGILKFKDKHNGKQYEGQFIDGKFEGYGLY